MAVLAALGFSKPLLARLALTARANGTTLEAELLASGEVEEDAYYGAMARMLRLPFISEIDPDQVVTTPSLYTQLHRPTLLRIAHRHRPQEAAIVPEATRLSEIAAALMTMPALGRNLAVTTPSAVRRAVWKAGEDRRVRETTNSLFEQKPALSARVVLSGAQGFYGGILLATIIVCFTALPFETLGCLHVALSFTYFASLILRIVALVRRKFTTVPRKSLSQTIGPLPRYTIMVALYREAGMAEQLLRGLERLDWPASLLDIKLVCEADDRETIDALRVLRPGPQFEIVEVPPYGPRTKPKALTYALAAARGEFLAIYDAEDRPHPQQLREAYQHFRNSPPELGCLQAPLIITNVGQSWLSALFSLEYSGLFRGLLPMLGKTRMPMPLGGTSNHFRTAALIAAGGWDPYNVTEDADMGIRLYRLGYRSDVIQRQTLEDAPVSVPVWVSQRTRWFKGWVQTWLVLMRDPRRLIRDMGLVPFLILQLLVGGMLVSALLHPLILAFVGIGAVTLFEAPTNAVSAGALSLFILDSINIVGSYLTFLGLGIGSMIDHEKRLLGRRWMAVPLYWLMISYAAWRAVLELYKKPFFWSKTPHTPRTDIKGK